MSEMIAECMRRLDQSLEYVEKAVGKLPEEKIWFRPRTKMNAIGNLCLHIAGSEYQHLVSGIGNQPVIRDRPGELLETGGHSREELLTLLRSVRAESWSVVRKLTAADLERVVTITYPENSGMESYQWSIQKILICAAEHYSYHTGQIVYAAKWLQEEDAHLLNWKHYN
ncbi:DinB family protein [Paenibacillus sp. IHBB 3054]|uniref:DinB family protein n=1 Tax=Paenibacillus sp. IHBB 3054 TaxID=3425689 RepID=UPI003F66D057